MRQIQASNLKEEGNMAITIQFPLLFEHERGISHALESYRLVLVINDIGLF